MNPTSLHSVHHPTSPLCPAAVRALALPAHAGVLALLLSGQAATLTDAFASRTTATGNSVSFTGDSTSAGVEVDEPNHGGSRRRTLWGAWRAPGNGNVVIDTIGSDFNTVLVVYAGSKLTALHPVALNDDLSSEFGISRVSFPTEGGVTYSFVVDGSVNNNSGDGLAHVNVVFTPASQPAGRVGTDLYAERPTLDGFRAMGVCCTRFFSVEIGEPARLGDENKTAWWRWTAPANGTVTLDTLQSEAGFNTVLTVYAGTDLTNLSEVAMNDDASNVLQSRVSFQALAGLEYQVMVDGRYNNASGRRNVILNLQLTPNARPGAFPGHDHFTQRGRLSGAHAEGVAMNYHGSRDVNEPAHGSERDQTVWWAWTAPATGAVRMSTEGSLPLNEGAAPVNTFLAVYRGVALAGLQKIASDDDVAGGLWSRVEFVAQRGETYQIAVDGRYRNSSGYGNLRLQIDQAVPPQTSLAVYPAAEVELPGVEGVRYQLQASPDLIVWEDVGSPVTGQGQPIRLLDAVRGTNKRFYRYLTVP